MNPNENISRPWIENSRADHFERRKAEIKRLIAAGHTKKNVRDKLLKVRGFELWYMF